MVSRCLLYVSHRNCLVYVCLNKNKERRITHTIHGKQKKICIKEEKRQNLHLANKMFYVVLYTVAALLLLGCKRKQKKDLLVFFILRCPLARRRCSSTKKCNTIYIAEDYKYSAREARALFSCRIVSHGSKRFVYLLYTCLYLLRATFHCKVVFTF